MKLLFIIISYIYYFYLVTNMSAERIEEIKKSITHWYALYEPGISKEDKEKGIDRHIQFELSKDNQNIIRTTIKSLIDTLDIDGLKKYLDKYQLDKEIVKKIIINEHNIPSYTPLNHAVVTRSNSIEIMKVLLAFVDNSAINIGGHYRDTPLMTAIRYNNVDMVKYLLSIGADISIVDKWYTSQLVIAFKQENLNMEIVNCLLDAKANVNVEYDKYQERVRMRETPLIVVLQINNPDLVESLLIYGLSQVAIRRDLEYLKEKYEKNGIHHNDAMEYLKINTAKLH